MRNHNQNFIHMKKVLLILAMIAFVGQAFSQHKFEFKYVCEQYKIGKTKIVDPVIVTLDQDAVTFQSIGFTERVEVCRVEKRALTTFFYDGAGMWVKYRPRYFVLHYPDGQKCRFKIDKAT